MSNTALTLGNMVVAVLQWVILLWLFRRYVYPPLQKAMQKRRETIGKQINEAQQLRDEAEKLKEEQQAALKAAQDEARRLIGQARKQGEEEAKALVQKAQQDAAFQRREAMEDIARERDAAIAAIRNQAADLVVDATRKLLERQVNDNDQDRLIKELLQNAEQLQ
ncbi:MAG: F0F1 ATP synthase subunit B [Firmicutes bacterium]|nr:F0F1 ATP synthase subunit B [Bacillota bacterium]